MSADLEVHPVADLFPMMSEEELTDLADDIKERGQLQPIVLGPGGEILDGRNRYAACKLAGVEPWLETYEGDDPDGYALAVNTERRNLRPSQRHMIKEMARRRTQKSKNSYSESASEKAQMSEAATVLDHAPDLAQQVAAGVLPLYKAAEIARENKQRAKDEAAKRGRLREHAPDLLALVDDDQLSLDEAADVLGKRIAQAESRRSAEEAEARRAEQERRQAIGRYVDVVIAFLAGWETVSRLRDDPNREEVLAALENFDRERLLEIEERLA